MSVQQNCQDNPFCGNKSHSPVSTYALVPEPLSMNPISPMTYSIMNPSFKATDFNPLFTMPTKYGAYMPSSDCKDNPMCNYTMPSFTIEQNRKDNPFFGSK